MPTTSLRGTDNPSGTDNPLGDDSVVEGGADAPLTVRTDPYCRPVRVLHRAYLAGLAIAGALFVVGVVGAFVHEATAPQPVAVATSVAATGDTTYATYATPDGVPVVNDAGQPRLVAVDADTQPGDIVSLPVGIPGIAAGILAGPLVFIASLLVAAFGAEELLRRVPASRSANRAFLPVRLPNYPTAA